ncbi:hypothetical protein PACTADRAFT_48657 [Pachysolen tannophilus NRRL Y-2460]|uniref:Multiple RNA-binding domain-containing protein 1 n=1 Tax=Pachysolen tannophilus NRRL Y-2460 TaxID=669874 RepID=A0A1E4TYP4_PACTA|nr:hypothetical protein PACTADRAFT_48657 [Pachysolen tannophilus NRRL Y-2460]
MSRVIVKGLPKYLTEDKLKEKFGEKGDVTDVKLMKNRFGESRRFAFIGYRRAQDAEDAVRYFNKSFIDTSRIDVELAKTFADPNVPLSWREKKRLQDENLRLQKEKTLELEQNLKMEATARGNKNNKRQKISDEINAQIDSNPKLKEFMQVMKPSREVKSWSNDMVVSESGAPSNKDLEAVLAEKELGGSSKVIRETNHNGKIISEDASDDEYEDFNTKSSSNIENDDGSETLAEEQMISLSELPEKENINDNGEGVSDLDWLKQRQVRIKEGGEKVIQKQQKSSSQEIENENISKSQDEVEVELEKIETEQEKSINGILETGRLFLRNISYTAKEEDFTELFSKFGELESVHIAIDTRTGTSKGFAYIQFKSSDDAVEAYKELDKQIFQGRLLHILPGQVKKDHKLDEFDLKNLPLKKQRELKKKANASKSQFSWNSLFMNQDAVMESVASRLGVEKSALLDPENSSSAVKQALAEASVIGDVRKYFEMKGIDLTSFEKTKERDDKVVLVKNFPYGTTIEEIGELFSPFGELKRLLMPPAGTIAIVEFRDLPSARAAFTKLAFRRFKKSIIYLEKGPKDLFTREPTESELISIMNDKEQSQEEISTAKEAKTTSNDIMAFENNVEKDNEDTEDFTGPTVSVFVKNLNFSTTQQQLGNLFKPLEGFIVCTIKQKPDLKNPGKFLSMGFGFVEFKTSDQAKAAIAALDGHVFDGHKLQLKLSTRQHVVSETTAKTPKSAKSSKIIVKNLPFEATRKDVVELFSSFGQLKSVRVPKKIDNSTRGFAFVEFTLLKEAEQAMDQLKGVHLLGRRLVMQFAEKEATNVDEEIDKMTSRVKKQVNTTKMAHVSRLTGKRKIDGLEDDEFGDELDKM